MIYKQMKGGFIAGEWVIYQTVKDCKAYFGDELKNSLRPFIT